MEKKKFVRKQERFVLFLMLRYYFLWVRWHNKN